MTRPAFRRPLLLSALALSAASLLPGLARAAGPHDYPTIDRVLYVQTCMRDHPGPAFEMINKCACTIDAIARELKHDDYVEMSTASSASSIGGERGAYMRDVEVVQVEVRKYRALQKKAKEGCFIRLD